MKNEISSVTVVSDGIVVEFSNATQCYYPASFLLSHFGQESNRAFLNYDPSASLLPGLEFAQSTPAGSLPS